MGKCWTGTTVIFMVASLAMASCADGQMQSDIGKQHGPHACLFKHSEWGIEIHFSHPWHFHAGAHPFLLCGPKTDWPFLGGYRFLMTADPLKNRRDMIRKYDSIMSGRKNEAGPDRPQDRVGSEIWGASGSMQEKVEVLRTERIGRWTVVSLKKTHPQAQCPAMIYRIIGIRYFYDLKYPDCGAKLLFHDESRKHMIDIVNGMREL